MKRMAAILLLVAGWGRAARGQGEGLFADFSTALGNFTVALDYSNAPRAVASFVGLATGAGSWADPQGNVWQTKFYDGTLFHRIATNNAGTPVAIQGGGIPTRTPTTVDRPVGVSTSIYAAQLTTTGTTNIVLNLPVITTNPAAVPTNYVLYGTNFATNAPMATLSWIEATVTSSNPPMGTFTSRASATASFTNFTLVPQVTTNVCPVGVALALTTSVATFHAIAVQAVASNYLRTPTVRTNFVGPGYDMLENTTNGLAHSNGVISMANSGPNTDGSQFFIMVTNHPPWDGGYSVFGQVTTGMDVVAAIAAVAVDADERPLQDVVLSNVVIRRVGAAAQHFNIASQGVPIAESGMVGIAPAGTNLALQFEIASQTKMTFRESPDLQTWISEDGGFYTNATFMWTTLVSRATYGDKYFFHLSRIRYPVPVTSPATHRGRTYTFWWDGYPLKYEAVFYTNMYGGYAWATEGTNAPFRYTIFSDGSDELTQRAYSARLRFADDSVYGTDYIYFLGFNPGQKTNRFTGYFGQHDSGNWYPMSGVFTVK